jgi:hypothetical protein
MTIHQPLKVRLALVPDTATHPDLAVNSERVIRYHHAVIGKKGGKVRMARMTARQPRLFARKAARMRWSKVRAAEQAEKAERVARRLGEARGARRPGGLVSTVR